MRVDNGTVNFKLYDGTSAEFYGQTEVTLPNIDFLSETIRGGGISGELTALYAGHTSAMTMSISFRTLNRKAARLITPSIHTLDMRAAQQEWDHSRDEYVTLGDKYLVKITPTSFKAGTLAVASPQNVSIDFAVSYYAIFRSVMNENSKNVNYEKLLEIDKLNFIYYANGRDYLENVRKILTP
jgi:phage tail tube protein FII